MFKKKSEEKFKELEKKLEEKYIGLENEFKTLRYSINELQENIFNLKYPHGELCINCFNYYGKSYKRIIYKTSIDNATKLLEIKCFENIKYKIKDKKYIQIIIKNEDEEIKYSFVVHDDKAIQIDENIDFSKYDFEGEF
jgi:hypothetical protein